MFFNPPKCCSVCTSGMRRMPGTQPLSGSLCLQSHRHSPGDTKLIPRTGGVAEHGSTSPMAGGSRISPPQTAAAAFPCKGDLKIRFFRKSRAVLTQKGTRSLLARGHRAATHRKHAVSAGSNARGQLRPLKGHGHRSTSTSHPKSGSCDNAPGSRRFILVLPK